VWLALSRIVAGVLVAHFALVLFPHSLLHSKVGTLSTGTWTGAFDRWDAAYYTTIAAHGYPAHAPDARAFFPGYPLVVHLAYELTGGVLSYVQVAWVVSSAAFVGAALLLAGLVGRRFGTRVAVVSTALFCWFPTSVFYLAPYSEALFALEILAVAALIQRGRWWWAALVTGYATATSPEAVVLTATLVVAALIARRGIWRTVAYALIGSFGVAGYMAFLGTRFGTPFAFTQVQTDFHRIVVFPFSGLVQNIGAIYQVLVAHRPDVAVLPNLSSDVLWSNIAWMWFVNDVALVSAVVALVVLVVRVVVDHRDRRPMGSRVPTHWLVVLAGLILIPSATVIHQGGYVSTESAARLVGVAFPLYLGLALLVRRRPVPLIIGLGLSVGAALVVQVLFNLGYWVT
jgi:Gpi18-like mannosyltransferase